MGPRKLLSHSQQKQLQVVRLAASTVGALLKREGLDVARRARRKTPPYTQPFQTRSNPTSWVVCRFGGWFPHRDQQRIDPLTISDASRYLLRCQAVEKAKYRAGACHMRQHSGAVVCHWRSAPTNGPPLPPERSRSGLSALSIYWRSWGSYWSDCPWSGPEQNGRHERIHRTLKAETACPPAAHRRAQQRGIRSF